MPALQVRSIRARVVVGGVQATGATFTRFVFVAVLLLLIVLAVGGDGFK